MIRVTLACGHPKVELDVDVQTPPICPVCGERRVSRVDAPPPRFRGSALGPLVKES